MKTIKSLFTLFVSLSLVSCTLMMDDLELSEEERGFDEPVVEQSEFGEVTFQYNQGVRPITRNVQEYLVSVEHDSILYFMDNLPEEWRLRPGDLLAAGCTRKLPMGLNHRVLSVEQTGGLIKVVTTTASRNDIYKELDINLDFDYIAPEALEYDSLEMAEQGLDPGEFAVTDYSLLDAAEEDESQDTRADEEKSYKTLNISTMFEFPGLKKIPNFKVTGKVIHEVIQRIHYEENKAKDYKENWVEDHSVTTFDLSVSAGKAFKDGVGLNSLANTREVTKLLKDMKAASPNAEESKSFQFGKITIPIPSAVPISAFLEFDAKVTLNLSAVGHVVIEYHHAWKRSGYIYDKGVEKTIDDKVIREANTELKSIGIIGECKLSMNVRVGLGIEIIGLGLGSSIGIGLRPTVEFKYPMEWYNDTTGIDREQSYLKGYIDLVADYKLFFAPAGKPLASATTDIAKKRLFERTTHFSPRINPDACSHTYKSVWDEKKKDYVLTCKVGVNFEKLYTFNNYWHTMSTYPRLRVYHGTLDGKFIELKTSGNRSTVTHEEVAEAGKTYTFEFTQDQFLSRENTYICVPCLYDYVDKKCTEFREHTFTYGIAKPGISFKRFRQGTGIDLTEYLAGMDEGYVAKFKKTYNLSKYPSYLLKQMAYYDFCVDYKLSNVAFLRSWGLHVKVTYGNNTQNVLIDKDIEIANKGIHSGTYSILCEFLASLKITDKNKCLAVQFRPYTINMLGERTNHSYSKWYDIYYPHDDANYIGSGESVLVNIN